MFLFILCLCSVTLLLSSILTIYASIIQLFDALLSRQEQENTVL